MSRHAGGAGVETELLGARGRVHHGARERGVAGACRGHAGGDATGGGGRGGADAGRPRWAAALAVASLAAVLGGAFVTLFASGYLIAALQE